VGDQPLADPRERANAHVDHHGLVWADERFPVEFHAALAQMPGHERDRLRMIAMGQRNSRVTRNTASRRDSWHHFERDAFPRALNLQENILHARIEEILRHAAKQGCHLHLVIHVNTSRAAANRIHPRQMRRRALERVLDSIEVPLRITISLGQSGVAATTVKAVAESAAGDFTEALREPFRDTDFSSRTGYNPDFLNVPGQDASLSPVPEPAVSGALIGAAFVVGLATVRRYRNKKASVAQVA